MKIEDNVITTTQDGDVIDGATAERIVVGHLHCEIRNCTITGGRIA